MKKIILISCILLVGSYLSKAQESTDSSAIYKKSVLENTEIDILSSYYWQDGDNASVTGGIGTERLTDLATSIVVSVPLNVDDVLTIDAGISAYSSASSGNLNPFTGFGEDDDDNRGGGNRDISAKSPWVESSGASSKDVWGNLTIAYSHNSDDRNKIWSVHSSVSAEYDYFSFGMGGGYSRLFNERNTEVSLKGNVYFDKWSPKYPTELIRYDRNGGNLNSGIWQSVDILDQNGNVIDKNGSVIWNPENFSRIQNERRNSYSMSVSFSQILTRNLQISLFSDIILQDGWLSNPIQRVYFGDAENYYIGNPESIPAYETPANKDVFRLADDIERLPSSRLKIPVGARMNYYINEFLVLRSYYRYYSDDWGFRSHTAYFELPVKVFGGFTLTPSYRYYIQNEADYFAPFEQHLSTEQYYTSDYDLSAFDANQFGIGLRYTDIFTRFHLNKLGLKTFEVKYSQYQRSTGLNAGIITAGFKFVMDK